MTHSPKKPRNSADEGVGDTLRATQQRKQSDLVEEDLSPEIGLHHVGLSKWDRSVRKNLPDQFPPFLAVRLLSQKSSVGACPCLVSTGKCNSSSGSF